VLDISSATMIRRRCSIFISLSLLNGDEFTANRVTVVKERELSASTGHSW
jgi:hypothetical protein